MQEVESRKRPHLGDSDPLPSKKRAVSVNGPTILANGNANHTPPADEEPRDQDNLEVSGQAWSISLPLFLFSLFLMFLSSNSARRPFFAA